MLEVKSIEDTPLQERDGKGQEELTLKRSLEAKITEELRYE